MRILTLFTLATSLLATSLACAQNQQILASNSSTMEAVVPSTTAILPPSSASTPALTSTPAAAQQNAQVICGITHLLRCIQDLGEDDKGIFTSPLHVKATDAYWLAPMGAATGLALAYDADAQQLLGVDTSRINTANNISIMGEFFVAGGESAGIYFAGLAWKNSKLAETGRLAAETIIDSGTVTLGLKLATNRQRPYNGTGNGPFWTNPRSGWTWDSSFPSGHATASMSIARVVAGEYPHWYVIAPAYAFAETVSICRVLGRDHFPSDVLVGQTIGFLVGNYVLNHRALYRPGKKGAMARMMNSVTPIVDPSTQTMGAVISIPVGRQ